MNNNEEYRKFLLSNISDQLLLILFFASEYKVS